MHAWNTSPRHDIRSCERDDGRIPNPAAPPSVIARSNFEAHAHADITLNTVFANGFYGRRISDVATQILHSLWESMLIARFDSQGCWGLSAYVSRSFLTVQSAEPRRAVVCVTGDLAPYEFGVSVVPYMTGLKIR